MDQDKYQKGKGNINQNQQPKQQQGNLGNKQPGQGLGGTLNRPVQGGQQQRPMPGGQKDSSWNNKGKFNKEEK